MLLRFGDRQLGETGRLAVNDQDFPARVAGRQHAESANVIGGVHPDRLTIQRHA
jgi:hypothetical protein